MERQEAWPSLLWVTKESSLRRLLLQHPLPAPAPPKVGHERLPGQQYLWMRMRTRLLLQHPLLCITPSKVGHERLLGQQYLWMGTRLLLQHPLPEPPPPKAGHKKLPGQQYLQMGMRTKQSKVSQLCSITCSSEHQITFWRGQESSQPNNCF